MRKVLLIEDDALLCWLLEKILKNQYEVVIMNDGMEAWSWLAQGNVPDLETFMLICRWLEVSPDDFLSTEKPSHGSKLKLEGKLEVPEAIEAHLRADRTLPPATIEALSEMIRVAYKAAREGKLGAN